MHSSTNGWIPRRTMAAIGILIATVFAGATGGCVWDPAPFREAKAITAPAPAVNAPLVVETRNGNVSIERATISELKVSGEVRAQTQERARDAQVTVSNRADGAVVVSVLWPEGEARNGEGATLNVQVPTAWGNAGATVRTNNGAIRLAKLGGPADIRTSNGAVEVSDHDGTVTARSSNGSITLDFVEGAIDAETSNGRITVTDAAGPVRTATSNGRVRVVLTGDNAGPVDVRTSNGSVAVLVGPAFAGDLSVSTSNGGVTVDEALGANAKIVDKGRRSAKVRFGSEGSPAAASTVKTSNGSVEIGPAPRDTRGNAVGGGQGQ